VQAHIAAAMNAAPTAVEDSFSGAAIIAGNVFDNDTDSDFGPNGKAGWRAVLTNAQGVPVAPPAGLTFNANGTLSYLGANGSRDIYYRIDTGVWTDGTTTADMSPDSNVVRVRLIVTVLPPILK